MSNFRVFINFKTYPQATGSKAVELAETCQEVSKKTGFEITPIVQVVDLGVVKDEVKIPVWVEHVDPQLPGQATGWINLEAVAAAGAEGTLINHSEHPLPPGKIKQILVRVRKLKESQKTKFETMVAAKTLGQLERLAKLKPDFVAYEIAELIGGKLSITQSQPQAVKKARKILGEIPLIVGAGVNQPEDLVTARSLGAKGVLVSSAVVLAKDPKQKLTKLLRLLK